MEDHKSGEVIGVTFWDNTTVFCLITGGGCDVDVHGRRPHTPSSAYARISGVSGGTDSGFIELEC